MGIQNMQKIMCHQSMDSCAQLRYQHNYNLDESTRSTKLVLDEVTSLYHLRKIVAKFCVGFGYDDPLLGANKL